MNNKSRLLALLYGSLLIASSATAEEIKPVQKDTLFDNVAKTLQERYFDEAFREEHLPELIRIYRQRAKTATTFEAQREVVQAFLSNIPSTHLGLVSSESREHMMAELTGRATPCFGFELIEYDGKHYAHNVLEGGPAEEAGLKRGDRIMTVDGVLVEDSPRLGWRTDDAFLPDPPVRGLAVKEGDQLKLRIERRPGEYANIEISSKPYSIWEATKASARVIEQDGKRIGYIHFGLIQLQGPNELLKEKLDGDFAECDALVFDLRGRGGSGTMVDPIMDLLEGVTSNWNKPIAALINGHSRSAKDVMAYKFRERDLGLLVGERTAGAVIPVSLADVGFGMHLMFPSFTLGEHTNRLEFNGVPPDVVVEEAGPYSSGADPILEAGIAQAVKLADSEEWKTRREARRLARALSDGERDTPSPHAAISAAAHATGSAPMSLTDAKTLLEAEDAPGHDTDALDILARVVDALGGESALRRHKFKTIRGSRSIGGLTEGKFEMLQAAPNRFLQRMEFSGRGQVESGYNGEVGWQSSPFGGKRLMTQDELADAAIDGDILAELNYRKNHRSIAHLGMREFGGRKCSAIRLTKNTGKTEVRFIDPSNHLPIGSVAEVETNVGPMVMISRFDAYRAFDGEMIAMEYTQDVGGIQTMTTKVAEVSFDPVDAATFAPPEDIQ